MILSKLYTYKETKEMPYLVTYLPTNSTYSKYVLTDDISDINSLKMIMVIEPDNSNEHSRCPYYINVNSIISIQCSSAGIEQKIQQ
jgi:hypothetical protein